VSRKKFEPEIGIEMYEGGLSCADIARACGCSRWRVADLLRKRYPERYEAEKKYRHAMYLLDHAPKIHQIICSDCGKRFMWWQGKGSKKFLGKNYCPECWIEARKAYRRVKTREWYQKPENKARQLAWQRNNRAKMSGYRKKWFDKKMEEDPAWAEEERQRQRARYAADPHYHLDRAKEYYQRKKAEGG